ncbi:PEP-CTERM sorting domain-containing protein [Coraliomargarita sp. SDUM461003]|uniref:PEP-CTERM sorting domain-containing protein n=1 Tax=Thalassobacterium maritimum TaxID=3041265 RepID=A0ABU1AQ56_9BACT|nr:PEP-CTERM sorting domain-containing protein [Coraliomargarita sp. SDUM461003]MDQ8206307.1 PEP-CTERM sorting domain-containing protein [Coraliomargarita sp. SDUM461003]
MKFPTTFAAFTALTLSFQASVSAAVLADFNFDASSLASSDASTSWGTSDISNGAGLPNISGSISGTEGTPAPGIDITFADFDYAGIGASHTANGYYTFTVTPDAGTQLSFTDFTFDMFKQFGAGATVSATLFSSIDGFATTGDAIGAATLVGEGESGAFYDRSITLSSLTTVSTATEFRLYLDDGGAGNNANVFRLDNIVLNGETSVVPEPSSAAFLLGLGALGLVARRRV